MSRALLLVTACGLVAVPASAKPIDFSAVIEGHVGYGINPRIDTDRTDGTGSGSIRIAPTLTTETGVSQTTLQGDFQREQYTSDRYGHSQSLGATLDHTQTLNEHLNFDINAGFVRSNNVLLGATLDPSLLGDLASSTRIWNAQAAGTVTWQLSARDQLSGGGSYSHEVADAFDFSRSYNEYGANLTYLHTLDARTKIGLRASANRYVTRIAGNSSAISPAVVVQRQLNVVWKLEADVGAIIQRQPAPASGTTIGLGFHASLCGKYPRSSLCVTVGRDTSATAFSGLRRQLQATAHYNYQLTERSSISAEASFLHDQSGVLILLPTASTPALSVTDTVFRGTIEYNRQMTQRLSVGADGRGGYREYRGGTGKSVSGSIYVRYRIG